MAVAVSLVRALTSAFVAGLPNNYLDLSNQRALREKVYKNHALLRAYRTKKAASGSNP